MYKSSTLFYFNVIFTNHFLPKSVTKYTLIKRVLIESCVDVLLPQVEHLVVGVQIERVLLARRQHLVRVAPDRPVSHHRPGHLHQVLHQLVERGGERHLHLSLLLRLGGEDEGVAAGRNGPVLHHADHGHRGAGEAAHLLGGDAGPGVLVQWVHFMCLWAEKICIVNILSAVLLAQRKIEF